MPGWRTTRLLILRWMFVLGSCMAHAVNAESAYADDAESDLFLWEWSRLAKTPVPPTVTERAAPGAISDRFATEIQNPTLTAFVPEQRNGCALVIVPGGAYRRVVIDKEGLESARWFADHGYTTFVLLYRLPLSHETHARNVSVQDARQAIRLVRSRADSWNIDPHCIGALGFSAGGHVVASLLSDYQAADADAGAASGFSARPDFAVLLYPVISMHEPIAHEGSRQSLLGNVRKPSVLTENSADQSLGSDAPPSLIIHALDDESVEVAHALALFNALREQGIATELHLFEKGGHGFGMRYTRDLPVEIWPELVHRWVSSRHR